MYNISFLRYTGGSQNLSQASTSDSQTFRDAKDCFLVALLPYMVFSLFHTLTFIRTTILPRMYSPPPTQGTTSPVPPQTQVGKMIQVWVKCIFPLLCLLDFVFILSLSKL